MTMCPQPTSTIGAAWQDAVGLWWRSTAASFEPWRELFGPEVAWWNARVGQSLPRMDTPTDLDTHRCNCGHDDPGRECGHTKDASSSCRHAWQCCPPPEADVIVRSRAGETRVVPFQLCNPWRRERTVTLAVGNWQCSGGRKVEVNGQFEGDAVLVLGPCERRVVRLIVTVQDPTGGGDEDACPRQGQRSDDDCAHCASAYSDVRFEGCTRPQRVGVLVRSPTCDAVPLGCGCGCCD